MAETWLRVIDCAEGSGLALLLDEGEIRDYPSGLDTLEPTDGSLVALLADLGAHSLGLGGNEMIEGDVGGIHHNKAVACIALRREYRLAVIDRTKISGNLLDSLKDSIVAVFARGTGDDLERVLSYHDSVVFIIQKHITKSF